jgi:hypothetical protein
MHYRIFRIQPLYIYIYIYIYIFFAPKRKTTLGQPNSGNQLSEEKANYKKFVLTTLYSSPSLEL